MSPRRLLQRRVSTPLQLSGGSGAGRSLPPDLLLETRRRVHAVGLVGAGLWTFHLVANSLATAIMGHPMIEDMPWPFPGAWIGGTGVFTALLLVWLVGRLRDRPKLLLDVSAGFVILQCLLAAILSQWTPPPISPRVSWLCIMILIYPALVHFPPLKTLVVALIAASMDPLALWLTSLRGVPVHPTHWYLLWNFLPTYVCAVIAVVPAKVIRLLGQQVRRAREVGSYRLEEVLGKGGMGEVYRASHQMLARPAAVKLIRPEVLGSSSSDHARVIVERFRREAQASASLRSPHTISLYDFGVAQDGTFFLVMEMLEGLDLQLLVERFGALPAPRAVHLMTQACDSLEEAHARGLIHRDIKPSNIFTCRMGLAVDFVKVLDFGLVKARCEGEGRDPLLTAPDSPTGTPAFMAPELIRGDPHIDHRADIYALGCVAYWLLTGKLVFEARNAMQVMFMHASAAPVPPSQRTEQEIPPDLDALVLACLAKDPEHRPAHAGELGRRLAGAIRGTEWTQERAHLWWDRHHPETARPAPTRCGDLMLSKALGSEFTLSQDSSAEPAA